MMDVLPFFIPTWLIGIGVTALIFLATMGQHWGVRGSLRTLALAVTFTPSILVGGHGAGPAPAIVVLLSGLNPSYSDAAPLILGAPPIVIVWAVLMFIWTVMQTQKPSD